MAAPRKYPEELRERATRMAVKLRLKRPRFSAVPIRGAALG